MFKSMANIPVSLLDCLISNMPPTRLELYAKNMHRSLLNLQYCF